MNPAPPGSTNKPTNRTHLDVEEHTVAREYKRCALVHGEANVGECHVFEREHELRLPSNVYRLLAMVKSLKQTPEKAGPWSFD